MINKYYHSFSTCPNCHEPHNKGIPLYLKDEESGYYIKCSNCNTSFNNYFTFDNKDILNIVGDYKIPLTWEVNPNVIEDSYIDWVLNMDIGKYLITWPWKSVKFIPILVSEYLINNPNNKVIIITDFKNLSENTISQPIINELFENLFILNKDINFNDLSEKKSELGRININRKNVLIKDLKTHYIIKRLGSRNFSRERIERIFEGGRIECKNWLVPKLIQEYGENSIRNLKYKKTGHSIENENGFLDVSIIEKEEWGGDLKDYNFNWTLDMILSPTNFKKFKQLFEFHSISKENIEKIPINTDILIIDKNMNPSHIFKIIADFNPNMTIIDDFDFFVKDMWWGNRSKSLFKFLYSNQNTILMFSTQPDFRYLLKKHENENLVEKYSIELHSWDSAIVLNYLKKLNIKDKRRYYSPLSSNMKDLRFFGTVPPIDYIPIDDLDLIDNICDNLKNLDIRAFKFFKDFKKSPLKLRGRNDDKKIFKRTNFEGYILNYDKVMTNLERKNKELAHDIHENLKTMYNVDKSNENTFKNPLLNNIIKVLNDICNENNVKVSIIVHGQDVKGLKEILKTNFDFEDVKIVKWSDLNLITEEIFDSNIKHVVISSRPPSLDYPIYFAKNIYKFVFIGSNADIHIFKEMIEKRLTESISKPLNIKINSAPSLLKDIIKEIDKNEDLSDDLEEEIHEIINFNINSFFSEHNDHYDTEIKNKKYIFINEGSKSIFVKDTFGRGMFLPLNKKIYFKIVNSEGFSIEEILIKSSKINDLQNKEIIINQNGIYTSFKKIFFKFMIENGNSFKINNGYYMWDNFVDLIEDAYSWINVLNRAINIISKEKKLSLDESEEFLAAELSKLNLNAKDKEYIKNWWSEHEYLETLEGNFNFYEVEHPKSFDDLKKIFNYLNNSLNSLEFKEKDAKKSYVASRTLQKIRRDFFKNKEGIEYSEGVYKLLKNEIKNIINQSISFKIHAADLITVKRRIPALKIFKAEEYKEIIQY